MQMVPDGDVVRGLGFVSVFSGHLEAQINRVLELFSIREDFTNAERTYSISQRIAKAERLANELKGPRKSELIRQLGIAKDLFSRRNDVLHSSIYYASYERDEIYQYSVFPDVPRLRISAKDMYKLAEEIRDCQLAMDRPLASIAKELAGIPVDDA